MTEISVLIGGKAGDGVKLGSNILARLFNRLGYSVFVYEDYPSLIRGGHNFSLVRASAEHIEASTDSVDILIALNQETVETHKHRLKKDGLIIFDSDSVKSDGIGVPLSKIAKDNSLPSIVRNIISFGAVCKFLGVDFSLVENIIKDAVSKKTEENIAVAKIGYDSVSDKKIDLKKLDNTACPLITGNDAVALGAVKAGLKAYVAYPMTPASSILHTLAALQDDLGIAVVHPENEIAVALMAEGLAYAGVRSMVGTSGGGFALMTESLSFAGIAEFPIVFVLSQRPGPATGVPTYTTQGDLFFALHGGHGEFPRIVLAPGNVDEAFYFSAFALNLAWMFQTPVVLLLDKHLSESTYSSSFDENNVATITPKLWNKKDIYKRYSFSEDGISPLAFPGDDAVIKATSYEHDEAGITVEDSQQVIDMFEKREKKRAAISSYLDGKETLNVFEENVKNSDVVLVAWGSTTGVVKEAGKKLGLKVIQPVFLDPLPVKKIKDALKDAKKVVCVEINATGQLATLLRNNGISVDDCLLKFDGRPFAVDELLDRLKERGINNGN